MTFLLVLYMENIKQISYVQYFHIIQTIKLRTIESTCPISIRTPIKPSQEATEIDVRW